MDGSSFPLFSKTALRLSFEASINSRHSLGSCAMWSSFSTPSMLQQNTRPSSFLKKNSKRRVRNEVTRTFSSRRFHCLSLEANISALFWTNPNCEQDHSVQPK
ncbi:hypothetical protein AVEN_120459-1 [Araneus ventricosus]|uniref:Uncharacterized protein n=1 Tax=Araneus ventricosus TaxID=182803 RepID=A0A4Y2P4F2_ARAVE|nr:hypothetical protein AVEN_120459-1 [Araneus ventricosus]